ncbi:hypothetical protein ACOKM3_07415 [Streptomyces sp. BH106]|uniref:hypothetical protein n=1 Tax=Streptomyces sp. BH106 TaxID=3410409 RepID=UPI003CF1076B
MRGVRTAASTVQSPTWSARPWGYSKPTGCYKDYRGKNLAENQKVHIWAGAETSKGRDCASAKATGKPAKS